MTAHGDLPAPQQGLLVTHFLTVRDVERSRRFYADVFDGEVVMEESPAIVKVANSWIIMNPGGGPTPDKPGVTLEAPRSTERVSSFLNVRVADMAAFHADAVAKGAHFLTEPLDRGSELRCYLRDPDGYLIEVGQSTGLLRGLHAD
ncbi:VOC family protein [Streptomyces sp. NPDC058683]|uniref:VOC family protein n=1 Tax=Streptomyces sp. NPDC058683 TaxID=3346597 RepID=UPI0036500E3B